MNINMNLKIPKSLSDSHKKSRPKMDIIESIKKKLMPKTKRAQSSSNNEVASESDREDEAKN